MMLLMYKLSSKNFGKCLLLLIAPILGQWWSNIENKKSTYMIVESSSSPLAPVLEQQGVARSGCSIQMSPTNHQYDEDDDAC